MLKCRTHEDVRIWGQEHKGSGRGEHLGLEKCHSDLSAPWFPSAFPNPALSLACSERTSKSKNKVILASAS
eukprot:545844-Rhodomonas_salina.3